MKLPLFIQVEKDTTHRNPLPLLLSDHLPLTTRHICLPVLIWLKGTLTLQVGNAFESLSPLYVHSSFKLKTKAIGK